MTIDQKVCTRNRQSVQLQVANDGIINYVSCPNYNPGNFQCEAVHSRGGYSKKAAKWAFNKFFGRDQCKYMERYVKKFEV